MRVSASFDVDALNEEEADAKVAEILASTGKFTPVPMFAGRVRWVENELVELSTPRPSTTPEAIKIAEGCMDAYSSDVYRSWPDVAQVCLDRGLNAAEAEEVMRSKWTRWSADAYNGNEPYGSYPASAVAKFLDDYKLTDQGLKLKVRQELMSDR